LEERPLNARHGIRNSLAGTDVKTPPPFIDWMRKEELDGPLLHWTVKTRNAMDFLSMNSGVVISSSPPSRRRKWKDTTAMPRMGTRFETGKESQWHGKTELLSGLTVFTWLIDIRLFEELFEVSLADSRVLESSDEYSRARHPRLVPLQFKAASQCLSVQFSMKAYYLNKIEKKKIRFGEKDNGTY